MYLYYNANTLGRLSEDCTVRSISCATSQSWDTVYSQLCRAAKKYGTIMNDKHFIIDYLSKRYESVDVSGMTVGEVSDCYPDNVLLISMRGHITCSKRGVIFDTFNPSDRYAEFCWIVK